MPKVGELTPGELITPRVTNSKEYKPYGERANEPIQISSRKMADWGQGDNSQSGAREAYSDMLKNQPKRQPDLDALAVDLSTGTDDMEIVRGPEMHEVRHYKQTGS